MQRIVTMAVVAGLTAVLVGLVPASLESVGSSGNSTAVFNATQTLSQTATELLPIGVLILAAGAILSGTGILRRM